MKLWNKFFAIPFPVRLAWSSWILLLVGVGVRVLLTHHLSHSVVPIYLKAAHRWQAGENMYLPAWPLDVYRNPPGFAAMFTAFTVLPGKIAGVVWRLLSAAVLLAGLYRFAQCTGLTRRQTGYFVSLVAWLSILSVNNGQCNVMLAGCTVLGFALAMKDRLWPAAICLALAVSMKLYPLAAVLLAVLAVPRLGWRCAVATTALLAIPFAMQSPDYVLESYQYMSLSIRLDDRTASDLARAPQDWTILPRVWLDVVIASAASQAVSALAGIAFAALALLAKPESRLPFGFVLASIWMTLFGPATEIPTYTLLAPAAAWWAVARPSPAAMLAVVLLVVPIVRGILPMSEMFPLRSAAPFGAMLLLICLSLEVLRSHTGLRWRTALARFTSGAGRI